MDRRRGEGRQGERKTEMSEAKKKLRGDIKDTPTPCLSGRALGTEALSLEPNGSQSVRHMPTPGKCQAKIPPV